MSPSLDLTHARFRNRGRPHTQACTHKCKYNSNHGRQGVETTVLRKRWTEKLRIDVQSGDTRSAWFGFAALVKVTGPARGKGTHNHTE